MAALRRTTRPDGASSDTPDWPRSFLFEHPRWATWLTRVGLVAVVYVGGSLLAAAAGWGIAWGYGAFAIGLLVGSIAEELLLRRYKRQRDAVLEAAERRVLERMRR